MFNQYREISNLIYLQLITNKITHARAHTHTHTRTHRHTRTHTYFAIYYNINLNTGRKTIFMFNYLSLQRVLLASRPLLKERGERSPSQYMGYVVNMIYQPCWLPR